MRVRRLSRVPTESVFLVCLFPNFIYTLSSFSLTFFNILCSHPFQNFLNYSDPAYTKQHIFLPSSISKTSLNILPLLFKNFIIHFCYQLLLKHSSLHLLISKHVTTSPSYLCLNGTLVLLGYLLLNPALHEVGVVEGVGNELGLVVQPQIHVVAVHHRPKHVRACCGQATR